MIYIIARYFWDLYISSIDCWKFFDSIISKI